ncbi:uncharacterized protein ARB_01774 [Trichophyton benhamiae CBS 112371]|uniref:Uncharacterized protein n=1 Tax=Arthroderma benhamiae (strain ATCC MYA-4681 / CBS 112371) TaxID=663331 RepID=D4B003_ARTBC|nr:uncharacterized protein ARB_01774 [Trichophyton benhamiae CBS 112371]EFE31378.1 hypothetical protein ARB_01774 [Trichophyton benhamiae CBS 112371]
MDDTRDVSEDGQTDIDQEISTAASLEEDTDWREDDSKDDLADVAVEAEEVSRRLKLEKAKQRGEQRLTKREQETQNLMLIAAALDAREQTDGWQ